MLRALLVVLGAVLLAPTLPSAHAADDLPRRGVLGVAVIAQDGFVVAGRVLPGSAAREAGIMDGDVMVAVNGAAVTGVSQFLTALHVPAGTSVMLTIRRGQTTYEKTVVLPPAPREALPGVKTIYGTVNVDGSLRRTLTTVPDGAVKRLPAVLVVGGIGCYSVDNALDQLDPYRHLVGDLSAHGFVTMRVEKSGVGDSQGPPCAIVDFNAEYAGYRAGLEALRADPHADPNRVYVFGHSIGGLIAPRLAAAGGVAGVIVAQTVGIDWFTYEMINERRQAALDGLTPEQIDADAVLKEFCMHELLIAKKSSAQVHAENKDCADPAYPASDAYMQQVAGLNVGAAWMKVAVPVLAIYGRSDFITDERDHRYIVDIVNAHYPGRATFAPIDGMDHYLAATPSQQTSFERAKSGKLEATYDEALSDVILAWLERASP